jgi:hypothetical protein
MILPNLILTSTLVFCSIVLYKKVKLNPKTYDGGYGTMIDINLILPYIISTVHAAFTCALCSLSLSSLISENITCTLYYFSISYFASDTIEILISSTNVKNIIIYRNTFLCLDYIYKFISKDLPYIIHHVIVIYLELYTINLNDTARTRTLVYLNYIMLSEIAVLPLNFCWYMRQINPKNYKTNIYFRVIALCVLFIYFISRVLNFSYIFIKCIHDNLTMQAVIGIPIIILGLSFNYYWFYKLCSLTLKLCNYKLN